MKKGSLTAMIVVALLIGLVAGFYLAGMSKTASIGSLAGAGGEVKKGDYKDTFKDGWRAAKEKLEASGFYSMAMPGNKNSVSGLVKDISNGKIVIDTPLSNPLDDEALKTRTISLVFGAKITIRKVRPAQEIESSRVKAEAEMKSLSEEISNLNKQLAECAISAGPAQDPCADKRTEQNNLSKKLMELSVSAFNQYQDVANAVLSDIKPGYFVVVKSADDVSSKTEFSATEVEVTENSIAPPLAPPSAASVAPASAEAPVAPTTPLADQAVPPVKPLVQ